jgi:hypothetical protein
MGCGVVTGANGTQTEHNVKIVLLSEVPERDQARASQFILVPEPDEIGAPDPAFFPVFEGRDFIGGRPELPNLPIQPTRFSLKADQSAS